MVVQRNGATGPYRHASRGERPGTDAYRAKKLHQCQYVRGVYAPPGRQERGFAVGAADVLRVPAPAAGIGLGRTVTLTKNDSNDSNISV